MAKKEVVSQSVSQDQDDYEDIVERATLPETKCIEHPVKPPPVPARQLLETDLDKDDITERLSSVNNKLSQLYDQPMHNKD